MNHEDAIQLRYRMLRASLPLRQQRRMDTYIDIGIDPSIAYNLALLPRDLTSFTKHDITQIYPEYFI